MKKNRFYTVVHTLFAGVFKLLFRVKIVGKENEPSEDKVFLVCSNHISAVDPILVGACLDRHQVHYMAKKELFSIPVVSWFAKNMGAFPVDRGGGDVGAVKKSINFLKNGECVGLFPQGTRQAGKDPRSTKVKAGAGMIAHHANVDILPVHIYREGYVSKMLKRTVISIGKPIPFSEFSFDADKSGEYLRISSEIFDRICTVGEEAIEECQKK